MDPNASTRDGHADRLYSSATHDTTEHEKAVREGNVPVARTPFQRFGAHVKRHKLPYIISLVIVLALVIVLSVL